MARKAATLAQQIHPCFDPKSLVLRNDTALHVCWAMGGCAISGSGNGMVVGKKEGGGEGEGEGTVSQRNQATGSEATQITICMSLLVGIISRKQTRLPPVLPAERRCNCCTDIQGTWLPPMIRPGRAARDPHLRAHGCICMAYEQIYMHTFIRTHQNKYAQADGQTYSNARHLHPAPANVPAGR